MFTSLFKIVGLARYSHVNIWVYTFMVSFHDDTCPTLLVLVLVAKQWLRPKREVRSPLILPKRARGVGESKFQKCQ